jgi:hypothetical protein
VREQVSSSPAVQSFLAGGGCSVVAWAAVFPLDVIKSRVQSGGAFVQNSGEAVGAGAASRSGAPSSVTNFGGTGGRSAVNYSSARVTVGRCASDILRTQGVAGLYAGFGVGMARTVVANGVAMVVFDWIKGQLSSPTTRDDER